MSLRIGFIGTGGISAVHLECLKTRQDVTIAALCDVNQDNLRAKAKTYGGRTYTDFRKMLAKEQLDAVYVCTPQTVRAEPLIACADAGIPVFCEKPAARTAAEGEALAAELIKRKARVMVGYVFRPTPLVQKLKELMADDRVHTVQSFYGCSISRNQVLASWFYDKAKSGGALVDQATHNFDLLRYLFGEVVAVQGNANNPLNAKKPGYTIDETLGLTLKFACGMMATHLHTWVGDNWRNEITLHGEKRIYRLKPMATLVVEEALETREYKEKPGNLYRYENDLFVDAVKTGDWKQCTATYPDAVKSLALTLACDAAVVSGNLITIDHPAPAKKKAAAKKK